MPIIGSLFILAMVGCYASLVFALTHGIVRRALLAVGTVIAAFVVLVFIGFILNPG